MLESPRRGRQAIINFTTDVPKILDLKASFEQKCSENRRWVPLSKTNLEGVPNDPIIRGGGGRSKTSISFSVPFVSLKLTITCFVLTNIRLCYQSITSLAWPS